MYIYMYMYTHDISPFSSYYNLLYLIFSQIQVVAQLLWGALRAYNHGRAALFCRHDVIWHDLTCKQQMVQPRSLSQAEVDMLTSHELKQAWQSIW